MRLKYKKNVIFIIFKPLPVVPLKTEKSRLFTSAENLATKIAS